MSNEFPSWCDHEKVLVELNNYREMLKRGHTHTITAPIKKVCASGLDIWPPGQHTYGGDLVPCKMCGGYHNIYNFYKDRV